MIKILEFLKDEAIDWADFLDAFLISGYGASMSEFEFEYQKNQRVSKKNKLNSKDLMIKRKRLQKFLSKLKHDGLIKETGKNRNKIFISNRGKIKLIQLKNKLPEKFYKKESQKNPVIISFDIPEKLRGKRNWLREVIRNLGFKMIHQSVWVGKVKIPEQLIFDLEKINILEYIEIFEINKTGSLRKAENL